MLFTYVSVCFEISYAPFDDLRSCRRGIVVDGSWSDAWAWSASSDDLRSSPGVNPGNAGSIGLLRPSRCRPLRTVSTVSCPLTVRVSLLYSIASHCSLSLSTYGRVLVVVCDVDGSV